MIHFYMKKTPQNLELVNFYVCNVCTTHSFAFNAALTIKTSISIIDKRKMLRERLRDAVSLKSDLLLY